MIVRQLENFLTITELVCFASAVDRLYVIQPTISARHQVLKQFLGVGLFDRPNDCWVDDKR